VVSYFINFGLFFIALGAYGVFEGIRMVHKTGLQYGPGQYLAIISGLILFTGVIYYIQEVRKARRRSSDSSGDKKPAIAKTEDAEQAAELPPGVAACFVLSFRLGKRTVRIGPAILAFVLFILYALLTQWIGYLLSTALFVLSAMLLFGERKWWKLRCRVFVGPELWANLFKVAHIPLDDEAEPLRGVH
jgi:predicted membrane channel-forming protein YqfA (hemolysin III family)